MESAIPRGVEDALFRWNLVATLDFSSIKDNVEFIAAAFPNCILEDLIFVGPRSIWAELVDAIHQVADSIVVKGTLYQPDGMTHEDTLNFVPKFRNVMVSFSTQSFAACCR